MSFKISEFEELKYLIRYPNNYKHGDRLPVIIFLHGAGTRGEDITVLQENDYFIKTDKYSKIPFITVAPLCSQNTWFDVFEQLKRFVQKIVTEDFADEDRVYLMGASMGGYATWQLAMSLPETFAAIVPICGGGMYWNAPRLVNIPIWAFHGALDSVVHPEESKKMVEAVNRCGGNAKLTIYPENQHNAWSDTYADWNVFEWLFSKSNINTKKVVNNFKDSVNYG